MLTTNDRFGGLWVCAALALLLGGCGQQSAQLAGDAAPASEMHEEDGLAEGEGVEVPQFEFDVTYPKRLPNRWVLGAIGAMWVDSRDHVWVAQRPGSVTNAGDAWGRLGLAECCLAAPPVMEFDPEGNVVQAWGPLHDLEGNLFEGESWPEELGEWPSSEHGIGVDETNNAVWVSSYYPPSQVVKFTSDGKQFLLRIGQKLGSSNDDTENLNGPTSIVPDPENNEVFIADGYQNRRIIVYDATTGEFKRMWGAYGNKPEGPIGGTPVEVQKEDEPFPIYPTLMEPAAPDWKDDPDNRSQQFATIHCLHMSNDRLLYVCDRVNNRIQVFQPDGTYVTEGVVAPQTRAWGTLHDLSFSADPEQRFVYVADGTNRTIWILRRSDLTVLSSFTHGGRGAGEVEVAHAIGTDSEGNVYVGDTVPSNRIQRFLFKGLKRVPISDQLN